ncbi:MAG: hypothetical protein RDU76_11620 [Candidatus Edwardsbacteria bacterium]|nr:hypothetical protein [Candidatus Edwardsbacteria bacterium]
MNTSAYAAPGKRLAVILLALTLLAVGCASVPHCEQELGRLAELDAEVVRYQALADSGNIRQEMIPHLIRMDIRIMRMRAMSTRSR